jgi:hypothetical protein
MYICTICTARLAFSLEAADVSGVLIRSIPFSTSFLFDGVIR